MAAASTFLWSSCCLNVMYVPFTFCFVFYFPFFAALSSLFVSPLFSDPFFCEMLCGFITGRRGPRPSHRLCCLWALSGRDPSPRNRKRWCDWSLIKTCICSWRGDLWTEGLAARLYLTPLFTVKYTVMTDIRIMLSGAWWCFTGLCTSTQSWYSQKCGERGNCLTTSSSLT